jgi:hypothetical protein
MQLLGERNGRIVVGQLAARLAVLAGERNAVVDVEDAIGAAGRPDGGRGLDAVLLGVDLAVGEGAAAGEGGAGCLLVGRLVNYFLVSQGSRTYGLAGVLREVVGRDEVSCHAVVKPRVAVVGGVHDGVLEAAGVNEVQVELAVLGLVGGVGAGADVRLELIEAVGNDLLVCVSKCRVLAHSEVCEWWAMEVALRWYVQSYPQRSRWRRSPEDNHCLSKWCP